MHARRYRPVLAMPLVAVLPAAAAAHGHHPQGTLPPEQIRAVAMRHVREVRRCFEAHRADAPPDGRVLARFVISADGRVRKSDGSPHHGALAPVADCVAHEVLTWRFPPPQGGPMTVELPFNGPGRSAPPQGSYRPRGSP